MEANTDNHQALITCTPLHISSCLQHFNETLPTSGCRVGQDMLPTKLCHPVISHYVVTKLNSSIHNLVK